MRLLKTIRASADRAPTPDRIVLVRNAVDALMRGDTRACVDAISSDASDEANYMIHRIEADIEMASMCIEETPHGRSFNPAGIYPKDYRYLAKRRRFP